MSEHPKTAGVRINRAYKKANGMCVYCTREAAPGIQSCVVHQEYRRAYHRKVYGPARPYIKKVRATTRVGRSS